MTNIVDIVPRARKAVIEISLSLILATPGCTFLPRAREGQCRQLGTSPIKAVPLQPDPRPRRAEGRVRASETFKAVLDTYMAGQRNELKPRSYVLK